MARPPVGRGVSRDWKRPRRRFPRVETVGSCRRSFRDLGEQALGLLLQREDVGADLGEGAELGRLVEVAGEADFVADLGVGLDDPGVGRVGQDFAADEGFDAAFLQQRDLLEVAQLAVGLVFDDAGLAVDRRLRNRPRSGSGWALPGLWTFLMTGAADLRRASSRRRR